MSSDTPLHRACRDETSTADDIRRLIDADPTALTKLDRCGHTPLHLALCYHRNSPEILRCLLDRCPPEDIGLRTSEGCTPLYYACAYGLSIDIIRRTVRMYPKALRMLTNDGDAALHCAFYAIRPSLELLQLPSSECPIVCLLNKSVGSTPYDQAVRFGSPAAIVDFLLEATKQAELALLVFVDSALVTVSAVVVDHVHRVIPNFDQDYMSSNEPIRQKPWTTLKR
jgi:hypothetical protein